MNVKDLLIAEFDREAIATQKTLERVPADKWDWKPHEKSGTLGWLAAHVATLPRFARVTVETAEFEIAGANFPKVEKPADLLPAFLHCRDEARAALDTLTDEKLQEIWTLKWNGKPVFSLPRYEVLRSSCFNHVVHHRAQLTIYFRLLNVPVPPLYGPSADEQGF